MFKPINWPKSLPFALILFLYAVYLLSFSGKFHVMDELAVFTAGHNLARYGRTDINQLIWTNHWTPNPPGIWGADGNLYTKKPPGISFITAPLVGLSRMLPGLNAVQLGLLTNAVVTALTAGLLFIWLFDLGFSYRAATLTALGYGLGTFAWVYARMFWESSLLALTFLAAVWAAYRATSGQAQSQTTWPWLLLCGLMAAIGLTLRFEAALAVLLIGLYLLIASFSRLSGPVSRSTLAKNFPWASLMLYLTPSMLVGMGLLYFNFIRYGNLLETGYTAEILFDKPWVGAFGLLFSPGRGLFFYAPLTLLLFLGFRPAWRRLLRLYFWLIALLCLSYWLFYGSWFAWGGTWGWGPRFLLPILPLLMLFVAEPIEWAVTSDAGESGSIPLSGGQAGAGGQISGGWLAALRLALFSLVILSLIVNLLGLLVDFNEHFLRLGSNDNFVFNWATFPPLAHWYILQEGLVDLIWLRPGPAGLQVEWAVLLPSLLLLGLTAGYLALVYWGEAERGKKKLENRKDWPASRPGRGGRLAFYLLFLALAAGLTLWAMRAAAKIPLTNEQAWLDQPLLDTLATTARPGDVLLVSMPPFGDAQEITTHLMAYLKPALPVYAWIESDPRAIQPDERERVWQAVQSGARRVWLFERWLTRSDPISPTAARLNQMAFPVTEQWLERSGRLTLYALADSTPLAPVPLNIPWQGGLTLVDFAVANDTLTIEPGDTLKLRLSWQAAAELTGSDSPAGAAIVFAQLLDSAGQNVAQNDRLLIDLQNFKQSPLLPGQTVAQGYGLSLPDNLAPGPYVLIAGVYNAATGQRLGRADGSPDDFIYLTTLTVN